MNINSHIDIVLKPTIPAVMTSARCAQSPIASMSGSFFSASRSTRTSSANERRRWITTLLSFCRGGETKANESLTSRFGEYQADECTAVMFWFRLLSVMSGVD